MVETAPLSSDCIGLIKSKPLMAMVEVTQRCNMTCPICFADSGHSGDDFSLERIENALKHLLDAGQGPIPLQISGGEPTLHSDLPRIVAMAARYGFRNIELVTNGIRIGREVGYLKRLKAAGLSAVYLQFDGLDPQTHLVLRGRDMTQVRIRAIDAIRRAGLCCTLAVAVVPGVSEKEIGATISYGVANIDVVRAINFQSARRFDGRFDVDPRGGGSYSLPELLAVIEAQSGVPAKSFISEHIGHPACNALSLVFCIKNRLEPLFDYLSAEDVRRFLAPDPH